ncbi:MAG: DUF305 domain-containing protein [Candidatus Gastranaerophilales bacterium]|nr:DUF305 domain-containing protein [Candidatus Gastranaerophilales bacterium]
MRNRLLLVLSILLLSISQVNAQGGPPWAGQSNQPPRMMQRLGPADANYDLRFMDIMIRHKQHGTMMAQDALQKSKRSEIRNMTQKIINENNADIQQMQTWRKQWYNK